MLRRRVAGAELRFTGRSEGDLGHHGAVVHQVLPEVDARRRRVADVPWTWLRQVHGNRVVRARTPGDAAGERADAVFTTEPGCAVAVLTADCAPVLLVADNGPVGAAHAGWRGLVAGILEATVEAMRAAGAGPIHAVVGPCVHAGCYEFGPDDLATVVDRVGGAARGRTAEGRPALDLPAAVVSVLAGAGVDDVDDVDVCTGCSAGHYSHRARGELDRQAAVVWRA